MTPIHICYRISLSFPQNEKSSDKSATENENRHFTFSNIFFFENRGVYEIMLKNIVEMERGQITISSVCIACWILRLQTHTQNM